MANKVYYAPETAITFSETGASATFTPKNVANGAGRQSAQYDRGSGSKARRYRWEAWMESASNITVGLGIRIYIATAESAAAKNDSLGQSDAAITDENVLLNSKLIGQVLSAGTAAATGPFYGSGEIEISARYITVAYWNASGQTLVNTNDKGTFTLTPIPDEIQ